MAKRGRSNGEDDSGSSAQYADRPGNTPLRSLDRMLYKLGLARPGLELLAKLESHNPSGSAKERTAYYLFSSALESGKLHPGMTPVIPSSGNTGYACAAEAARRGFPCIVFIPEDAGLEKIKSLHVVGADVRPTPACEGSDGAYNAAIELVAAAPDKYCLLDQYTEAANWQAHFATTGPEVWAQTNGKLTHFIAGIGTGGTIIGSGRYLKLQNPHIQVIGVQPAGNDEPIPGLRYLGEGTRYMIPPIYDLSVVDRNIYVTLTESMRHVLLCARTTGLSVGPSSGAALAAAVKVCQEISSGVIVALMPDGLEKYASLLPTLLSTIEHQKPDDDDVVSRLLAGGSTLKEDNPND